MKISSTSERLKEIMKKNNLRQVDILDMLKPYSEEYGVKLNKNDLSQYVNGHVEPSQDKLTILGLALDVSEPWLMGYDVSPYRNINNILDISYPKKKIPIIGTIAAGQPILAEEHIEDYIDIESTIEADFCLRVKGNSMINANIDDGDYIFIKQQPDVEDGEIAAVLIEEEATLKRVYKVGDYVQLRAENPSFKPITLDGSKPCRILGKATYVLSKVK